MTGGACFFYRARRAGAARRPRGAPPNGRRWATTHCRSHGVHHRRACGLVLLLEARFKRGCRLAWSDSALSSSYPRRLEARGATEPGEGRIDCAVPRWRQRPSPVTAPKRVDAGTPPCNVRLRGSRAAPACILVWTALCTHSPGGAPLAHTTEFTCWKVFVPIILYGGGDGSVSVWSRTRWDARERRVADVATKKARANTPWQH